MNFCRGKNAQCRRHTYDRKYVREVASSVAATEENFNYGIIILTTYLIQIHVER